MYYLNTLLILTYFCNEMNYITFERSFSSYHVFSVYDIIKQFPDFDKRRLFEWQKKNYLIKVRRGYYCFTDSLKNEPFLYYTANRIYRPSYISMETALAYYNFIPEEVFIVTSLTSRNTAFFNTPLSYYDYKSQQPRLFFGYTLVKTKELSYKIAEPEKVILDFFYNKKIDSIEDIHSFRFNKKTVIELLDEEKLEYFRNLFNSKTLDKKINLFKRVIYAKS